jgi:two-component system sensor histidine kinase PhoQ
MAGKVMAALDKVYYDKGMVAESLVDADLQVQIDRQDLMELLGNLLDNAYKYGRHRIVLTASVSAAGADLFPGAGAGAVFECCVADDGPGIDEALWDHVLQRGGRIESGVTAGSDAAGVDSVSGQGIGLAVVQDIVAAYAGQLLIERSRWQGARVCVRLPLIDMPL